MPEAVKPLHQDPFLPILLSSEPLDVTLEQKNYIRWILERACSDSRFAQKAYDSIVLVLTSEKTVPSEITSLSPNSANIGDPSFTLKVNGKGFTPESVIVFAGQLEPTTFVSDTEVSTGVDMSVWHGADIIDVMIQDKNGVLSDPEQFTFNMSGVDMNKFKADRMMTDTKKKSHETPHSPNLKTTDTPTAPHPSSIPTQPRK